MSKCQHAQLHPTMAPLLVVQLHLVSTRPRRIRLTRKLGSFCQSSLFPLFGLHLSHTFIGTLQTSPGFLRHLRNIVCWFLQRDLLQTGIHAMLLIYPLHFGSELHQFLDFNTLLFLFIIFTHFSQTFNIARLQLSWSEPGAKNVKVVPFT